jgi:hypothetical protein
MVGWVGFDSEKMPAAGIYAIAYCWDSEEGVFVGVGKWNGKQWAERLPIVEVSDAPFDSVEAASTWAEEHDEWC